MKHAGLIAACLAFIIVACGTGNPTSATPASDSAAPKLIPLGAEVEVPGAGLTLKVRGVLRPANEFVKQTSQSANSPNAAEEWLQVRLELTCAKTASDPCDAGQFLFRLAVKDGKDSDPLIDRFEIPPADTLFRGTKQVLIQAGQTVRGSCYYIVPKSLAKIELQDDLTSPELIFATSE